MVLAELETSPLSATASLSEREFFTWVDAIQGKSNFIEEATIRLAEHWNSRTPGYAEYLQALGL